jgi:hypothetical protein
MVRFLGDDPEFVPEKSDINRLEPAASRREPF